MPWQEKAATRSAKTLRIGLLQDDGVVRPTPSVIRALQIVTDALHAASHQVTKLPNDRMQSLHRRSTSCVMKSNVQSGGYSIMKHIEASGEPVIPRTATGHPGSCLTTEQVFANRMLRSRLAAEYNDVWLEYGLDAILAPAVAHPAPPHGRYISNAFAAVFNMLDYVTGSVPVTFVDQMKDIADQVWYDAPPYPRIEPDFFPYDLGDAEMKELYTDPDVFANAPVGVQIVWRRLQEEKCVSILKDIETLLRGQ